MSKKLERQDSLLAAQDRETKGAVECLGLTFETDEARRTYFLAELKKKLADPEFRKIEGFPIGSDEDILRLSDPPYHTACPNPFIEDSIGQCRQQGSSSEPAPAAFATDISEGKGDHYYNVHTYHTKVPYRAIARFLLHYTRPGAIVLDAFAGTGTTGLAAQACASTSLVHELDPSCPADLVGPRNVILGDLSPAATHIAYNYNAHLNWQRFVCACEELLNDFEKQLGWMFSTVDPESGQSCPVDYYVWSDVFACPECGQEMVFWEEAVDQDTGHKTGETTIPCPACKAEISKNSFRRVETTYFDDLLGGTARRQKEKLISITYRRGKQQLSKAPDAADFAVLDRINKEPLTDPVPILKMLGRDGVWGDMFRAGYHLGITHFHHFYTRRSLRAVASLWRSVESAPADLRPRLRWWLQSVSIGHTRMNRYFSSSYSQVNRYLKGFLYIAQVRSEVSPWYALKGKISRMAQGIPGHSDVYVTTGSASDIRIPDNSVDYIFTDPPFGGNIIYSELNFMWEAWLGVFTNQAPEAIMSGVQGKDLGSYESLMQACFDEYFRVLKPGYWMTVLFHNSSNAVWAAIQSALERAGFVVADVRIFDKKQLTMKQQTTTGAVQKDLLISAYRPNGTLVTSTDITSVTMGSVESAWEFVRQHLKHLPVVIANHGRLETVLERQAFLLFDRMVAFHVQRRVGVPISAGQFYEGLAQKFPMRDDMYFLPEQVDEYDRKRMQFSEAPQLELFVKDEASAIRWLRQQLVVKPQTFQEVHPRFTKEIAGWEKHERSLELRELLDQNFLCFSGEGDVPSQIHSYLSSNFHDLRNLEKDAIELRRKAKDRYYVPDPNKVPDVQKTREKALLREFEDYRDARQKKLKVFRLEAVRAGFRQAWQQQDYMTIVTVAEKIPEDVLQEDPMLLMWYTNSQMRTGQSS
jgi:DNA modification methylase